MGLTASLILVGTGLGLGLFAIPRWGDDLRPFLKSSFIKVAYPSLCPTLIAFGAASTITGLMRPT